MKYIKHIVLMVFVLVMANAWAQNTDPTIPARTGSDNLTWTFDMPGGNQVLRTTWKQDAGLAYAKSDTTVYLGDPFSGQELTNPHGIPVTYSIAHKSGTNSGNTINNSGIVTINGVGIDTVKAIFVGNDTLLPDTAYYIIDARTAYYTLTLIPADHGTVTLTGATGSSPYSIDPGTEITLTATAHDDYHFVKWNDNSTENPRTVTITKDSTFSAVFVIDTVRLDSVRTTWTVQVDGVAKAVTNYVANPTANDTMGYMMIPVGADVVILPQPEAQIVGVGKLELVPIGAINSKFSVSSSKQVYFSKGNLQAATTDGWQTWTFSFMEHQYSMVETNADPYCTDNYGDKDTVSLFGWGTSGYNHGAICYKPNCTSNVHDSYKAYGNHKKNLFDESGKADWGYNAISNGGNTENSGWRTLTIEEWAWVLGPKDNPNPGTNCRTSSTVNGVANARFAKAYLFGTTRGLIVFPDNYTHPEGMAAPTGINATDGTSWNANKYSSADWAKMEAAGAVFLPAAGGRDNNGNLAIGLSVTGVGDNGRYWSSSIYGEGYSTFAKYVTFGWDNNYNVDAEYYRSVGHSVRLVKDAK